MADHTEKGKTMREKLIELLSQVQDYGTKNTCEEWSVTVECKDNETVADHLIANGVTVQQWISVKDRLPDKDGTYLVRWDNKSVCDAEYESKYGSFGYWLDIMWDGDADWYPYTSITNWMPLPEPPKGE